LFVSKDLINDQRPTSATATAMATATATTTATSTATATWTQLWLISYANYEIHSKRYAQIF